MSCSVWQVSNNKVADTSEKLVSLRFLSSKFLFSRFNLLFSRFNLLFSSVKALFCKLIFFNDNYAALENCDALVLMTEWKMFRNPNLSIMKELMKNYCIFDGRNQYDPEYMRQNGFYYKGIGR